MAYAGTRVPRYFTGIISWDYYYRDYFPPYSWLIPEYGGLLTRVNHHDLIISMLSVLQRDFGAIMQRRAVYR